MATAREFTLTHGRMDARGLVYLGGPKEVDEGVAETAVTPGAVLAKGTAANEVVEAGANANDVVGIALENDWITVDPEDQTATDPADLEADIDADHPWLTTDFAAGEAVDYAKNRGVEFRGILAVSQTVVKGDTLVTAASGELQLDNAIAEATTAQFQALEDVTTGTGATARIAVVWVR